NNQLLRFDDEEEHEAADEQPRPYPERDCLGLEERLERRRIGEQELQDNYRTDPHRQILVTEMRLERQGRVELVAAIEQIEHLTDHQRIHGYCPSKLVGRLLRLHPEECPQGESQQRQSDENDAPHSEGVQDRTVDRARL